jgi:hypothetical protein
MRWFLCAFVMALLVNGVITTEVRAQRGGIIDATVLF